MKYTQKAIKEMIENPNCWKIIIVDAKTGILVKEFSFRGKVYRKIALWREKMHHISLERSITENEKHFEYGFDENIYPYDSITGAYSYPIRKTTLCNELYELAREDEE